MPSIYAADTHRITYRAHYICALHTLCAKLFDVDHEYYVQMPLAPVSFTRSSGGSTMPIMLYICGRVFIIEFGVV